MAVIIQSNGERTKMPSSEFCKAVLDGMKMEGYSDKEIQNSTGISPTHLTAAQAGQRPLTTKELLAIEAATGTSAGQLAAKSLEPDGGPLTEVCDIISEARVESSPAKPRRPKTNLPARS
jgi:hypothetical protein